MTDKLAKARAEIEKAYNEAQNRVKLVKDEYWEGKVDAYRNVLCIFDSLQEEPVSKDKFTFTSLPRLLDRIKPTDRVKWYSSRLADALEEEGYITDAKIVRESIKIMNGEKVPMATMDEEPVSEDLEKVSKEWLRPQLDKSYVNYGEVKMMELTHFDGYAMLDAIEFGAKWQKTKDESTTEDLGEYINELSKQFPEVSFAKLSRIAVRVAKWKKEQFEKNRLAACDRQTEEEAEIEQSFVMGIIECENRQPTFDDAIKYGMRLKEKQFEKDYTNLCNGISTAKGLSVAMAYDKGMADAKEQMMAKAKSGTVQKDNQVILDNGTYIDLDPSMQLKPSFVGLKEGDRIKVIVIKED